MDEIIQGLLSPEQYQQTRERANIQGLMNLGQALIQAGQGGGGRRVSTLAGLGMAAPAYAQGRQQAFDQTLQDILRRTQVQDLLRQRQEQEKARQRQALFQQRLQGTMRQVPTGESLMAAQSNIDPAMLETMSAQQVGQQAMQQGLPTRTAFDRDAYLSALAEYDPQKYAELMMRPEEEYTLGENQVRYRGGRPIAAGPEKAPDLTTDQRNYIAAQAEGYTGTFQQFMIDQRRAGAPTTNVSFKDTSKEFSGTLGDQIKEIRKGGSQARSTLLPNVQTMKVLLDEGVRTGFGQPTLAKLQQAAQLVNPNFKFEKNIAGIEAFESAATQVILPQVKQLGVNPTDTDLKFIERGSPTLAKSTEGNRLMLDALELKAQRDIFLQNWVADWQSKNVNLIESSAVRADAKLQQDLNEVFANNPLFASAAERLRQRYQAIGGGSQVQSKLRNSPLFKQ